MYNQTKIIYNNQKQLGIFTPMKQVTSEELIDSIKNFDKPVKVIEVYLQYVNIIPYKMKAYVKDVISYCESTNVKSIVFKVDKAQKALAENIKIIGSHFQDVHSIVSITK